LPAACPPDWGFAAAALSGEENADEMRMRRRRPVFLSNNAGGILGGISTGQDIVVRFAVKPTSSIPSARRTVTEAGENVDVSTRGRHDPCVGIRAVPVGEAMTACVLADHLLRHRAGKGSPRGIIQVLEHARVHRPSRRAERLGRRPFREQRPCPPVVAPPDRGGDQQEGEEIPLGDAPADLPQSIPRGQEPVDGRLVITAVERGDRLASG
jgi:hypothetical protein